MLKDAIRNYTAQALVAIGSCIHLLNAGIFAKVFGRLENMAVHYLIDAIGYENIPKMVLLFHNNIGSRFFLLWLIFSSPIFIFCFRLSSLRIKSDLFSIQFFLFFEVLSMFIITLIYIYMLPIIQVIDIL